MTAGWGWGALLIIYFVASSALSRWRRAEKAARTGAIVEKGGDRDARQVLANGGVFAIASIGALAATTPRALLLWGAAGAGALAAAAADTWATEIGTLAARPPRFVLTGRRVPVGTSGAVSWPGMLALVAGAAVMSALAAAFGVTPGSVAVAAGGIVGSMSDTLLGAVVQERRWCDGCAVATERRLHDCGRPTRRVGGVGFVDNDAVNAACTLVGAATSVALSA